MEKRALRPYRRFVRVVFFAALTVLCGLILWGLIQSIDRLPTKAGVPPAGPIDVRALRACAEDLEKLEKKLRLAAGELISRDTAGNVPTWQTFSHDLDMERLSIVTRCRLDGHSDDPAVEDLRRAVTSIEDMSRSYGLLYHRHLQDGHEHGKDARKNLKRVIETLKARQ